METFNKICQEQRAPQDDLKCCWFCQKGSLSEPVDHKDRAKEISVADREHEKLKDQKKQQPSTLYRLKTTKMQDLALKRKLQRTVSQNGGS